MRPLPIDILMVPFPGFASPQQISCAHQLGRGAILCAFIDEDITCKIENPFASAAVWFRFLVIETCYRSVVFFESAES
jgi:hypothetical protein